MQASVVDLIFKENDLEDIAEEADIPDENDGDKFDMSHMNDK